MIASRILFPITAVALAGCTAVSPKEAFKPAAEAVATRTGVNPSRSDTAEDEKQIATQVADLLKSDLTVDAAIQIAVINNRTLRGTFDDIQISQAELMRASRLANPTFSASVRWPKKKPRGPNTEFSLVADLLEGLLIPLKRTFAQAGVAQAQRRVAHEVINLITEVKAALYTVQAHQMLRDRLVDIVAVNDATADLASRQFNAGNINHLELLNHQVFAQEARLELTQAEAQVRSDREVINRLLGLWGAQTDWKMTQPLPGATNETYAGINFESIALRQRLDLEVARTQVNLAQSSFKLKSSTRWLPASVNVGVDTEREAPGDRLTGPTLELSLPIFSQRQPELVLLAAELRHTENSYAALAIDIRSEVREKRDQFIAAAAAVNFHQSTLLPQRRAIVRDTLLHYNAMQKSSYELFAAREQELLGERESIEALRHYWIARAEFERALGGRLDLTASSKFTEPEVSGAMPSH